MEETNRRVVSRKAKRFDKNERVDRGYRLNDTTRSLTRLVKFPVRVGPIRELPRVQAYKSVDEASPSCHPSPGSTCGWGQGLRHAPIHVLKIICAASSERLYIATLYTFVECRPAEASATLSFIELVVPCSLVGSCNITLIA